MDAQQQLANLFVRIDQALDQAEYDIAERLAREACELACEVFGEDDPVFHRACKRLELVGRAVEERPGQAFKQPPTKQKRGPKRAVSLIDCPACDRQISSQAEACPQCGHPHRPAQREEAGPLCCFCSAPATTRCQSCGRLSCVLHLQSIYVRRGRGGSNELRCSDCYSSAATWNGLGCIVAIIAAIIMATMIFNMSQPGFR